MTDLVVQRPHGLYCPPGDFYIDPWRPVDRAVITHAHADHARPGHAHYLAARPSEGVLRARLGDIRLDTLAYGERLVHRGVTISLHPAGHVLGSAQVRLEHGGQVWVASGDYKVAPDPTCAPFEPVRCDTFITESTFGLPVYRWPSDDELFAQVNAWWAANAAAGRASVLACYSFGKAQRLLGGIDPSIGPVVVHGAVECVPADHEKAAHGVAQTHFEQSLAECSGKAAGELAGLIPLANTTPFHVARAHHEVAAGLTQGLQHLGQDALIVLQVGIHHSQKRRGGGHHAFDASRGQAPALNAVHHAHAWIHASQLTHMIGRAIR